MLLIALSPACLQRALTDGLRVVLLGGGLEVDARLA
jgi:hypothetical protein